MVYVWEDAEECAGEEEGPCRVGLCQSVEEKSEEAGESGMPEQIHGSSRVIFIVLGAAFG